MKSFSIKLQDGSFYRVEGDYMTIETIGITAIYKGNSIIAVVPKEALVYIEPEKPKTNV